MGSGDYLLSGCVFGVELGVFQGREEVCWWGVGGLNCCGWRLGVVVVVAAVLLVLLVGDVPAVWALVVGWGGSFGAVCLECSLSVFWCSIGVSDRWLSWLLACSGSPGGPMLQWRSVWACRAVL